MKMYKLTYEYFYMGGDRIKSTLGYFDDETKALQAWNNCFSRERVNDPHYLPSGQVDDVKREYTFSCCGWREWYRLEEFEYDNKIKGWGGQPCRLNSVDMNIKDAVQKLSNLSSSLLNTSLNYALMSVDQKNA